MLAAAPDLLPALENEPFSTVPSSVLPSAPGSSLSRPAEVVGSQRACARSGTASRWSADLWLALREGEAALFGNSGAAPVYGASQVGSVLRYRLSPASRHKPAVYVRAVQALDRREGDLAAGFAAQLVPGLPLTAHVEARLSHRGARVQVRPAAFLTAGVDNAPLPLGLLARGYAQGGYVGGRDATAFADGSIIAERPLLRAGKAALSAGAGVWGGSQRGAARLDIGPSASLRLPLGAGSVRLAVDYRLRAAGDAAPASGAALTLSAGF